MKYYFDGIIVVEGRNDVSFLSSFIDSLFVVTNGYDIPIEEIEFLNNPRNKKPIIILTDSDEAGKEIRNRLNKCLNNPINVSVDILKCDKNGKHGVAECDKAEVINVLKEHFTKEPSKEYITLADLTGLGIDAEKREYLSKKLSLGICNNKTFIKRLEYLNYSLEEIEKELK